MPRFLKSQKPSLTTRQFVQFEKAAYKAGVEAPDAVAHLAKKKGGMQVPDKVVHGFWARWKTDRNINKLIEHLEAGGTDAVFGKKNARQAITALKVLKKQQHFNKKELKEALDPVSTQKLREAAKVPAEVKQRVASLRAGEMVLARPDTDPDKKTSAAANACQKAAQHAAKTWTDVLLYECPVASGRSQVRSELERLLESRLLVEKIQGNPALKGLSLATMRDSLLLQPQARLEELLKGLQKEIDQAMAGDHSAVRHQRICNCCELLKSHIAQTIEKMVAAARLFANELPQADLPFQVQQTLARLGMHLAGLAAAYADPDGHMMQCYRLALNVQARYERVPAQPSATALQSVDGKLREVELLYRDFERLCLPPSPEHGSASEPQQRVFEHLKQGLAKQPATDYLTPAFVSQNLFRGIPEGVKSLQKRLQALIQRRDPQHVDPRLEQKIEERRKELGRLVQREVAQLKAVGALLLEPVPGDELPDALALSRAEAGQAMLGLARRLDDKHSAWRWMGPNAEDAEGSDYEDGHWIADLASLQEIPVDDLRERIQASPRQTTAPRSSGELERLDLPVSVQPMPLQPPPRPTSPTPTRPDLPRFSLRQKKNEDAPKAPRKRQDARAQLTQAQPAANPALDDSFGEPQAELKQKVRKG